MSRCCNVLMLLCSEAALLLCCYVLMLWCRCCYVVNHRDAARKKLFWQKKMYFSDCDDSAQMTNNPLNSFKRIFFRGKK